MPRRRTQPARTAATLAVVAVVGVLGAAGCGGAGGEDAPSSTGAAATGARATAPSAAEQRAVRAREREATRERARAEALTTGRRAAERGDWDGVGEALEDLDEARDTVLRREARARLARVVQPSIDRESYAAARRELNDGRDAFGLRDAPVEQLKLVRRELAAERRATRRAAARRERRETRERREASTAKRGLRAGGRQGGDDLCAQIDEQDFPVPPGDPRDPDGDGVGCED